MDSYLDQFMEDHIGGGYGDILDQLNTEDQQADDYPNLDCDEPWDEPWDETLAQQELEDFERCDEYFGYFGGDEDW